MPRFGGLDALNFFVANLQTGFGPFIAVYLTTHQWTQVEIGLVLSIGTIASVIGQLPGGALIDALAFKGAAAVLGLSLIAVSATLLALDPDRLAVTIAMLLHSLSTCVLVPAIAAMTLRRVRPDALGERFGRNARFAALGNAIGAGLMGAVGTWVSSRAVFFLAALLCLPAIVAVRALPPPVDAVRAVPHRERVSWLAVLLDRRLIAFCLCAVLFHLSNAAMLPIVGGEITARTGGSANIVVAACLIVPQFIVAALSPWVGRAAERHGRRRVLIIGFCALPIRALLFAFLTRPVPIVMAQAVDGLGGAVFGVLVPLICADITRGTNRFNLCVGAIGLAVSVGATLSTTLAGWIATAFGTQMAFLALACAGVSAVAAVAFVMPETRPDMADAMPSAPPSPAA